MRRTNISTILKQNENKFSPSNARNLLYSTKPVLSSSSSNSRSATKQFQQQQDQEIEELKRRSKNIQNIFDYYSHFLFGTTTTTTTKKSSHNNDNVNAISKNKKTRRNGFQLQQNSFVTSSSLYFPFYYYFIFRNLLSTTISTPKTTYAEEETTSTKRFFCFPSSSSCCGFLSCQFLRSAAVMQFCILMRSNNTNNGSDATKVLTSEEKSRNKSHNRHHSLSSQVVATKHISKMMARIEGWGNHHHHYIQNSSSSSSFLDSTLLSNKISSDFLKSRGKPRVRVGSQITIVKKGNRTGDLQRDNVGSRLSLQEEVSRRVLLNNIKTQTNRNFQNQNPLSVESKRHLFRMTTHDQMAESPFAFSNNGYSSSSSSFSSATPHSSEHTRHQSPSSSFYSSTINNSNTATTIHNVILHPKEMSPLLAAHVDAKTREMEKVFRLAAQRHQETYNGLVQQHKEFQEREERKQNKKENDENKNNQQLIIATSPSSTSSLKNLIRSDPESRRILQQSERQMLMSWTNALRVWIGDTGKFATLVRNYDDSLTGYKMENMILKLQNRNNGGSEHQVGMMMMNERSSVVENSYYGSLMRRKSVKNASVNSESNSETHSSMMTDVSVIARNAWFASVYCGLWREALAVGAPPMLVASALSTMPSSSSSGSTLNINNNNNQVKAACSAYLMSFEKYMMTKKQKTKSNNKKSNKKSTLHQRPFGTTKSIGGSSSTSSSHHAIDNINSTTTTILKMRPPTSRTSYNTKEFMSSASLGCYLALQVVKAENQSENYFHHHNQNHGINTKSNNSASWHDALKIVKVLSYRGHLVHPSFHIKLANTIAYRSNRIMSHNHLHNNNNNQHQKDGLVVDNASGSIVTNSHFRDDDRKRQRWIPAAMVLQHVCCESKPAFQAWMHAKSMMMASVAVVDKEDNCKSKVHEISSTSSEDKEETKHVVSSSAASAATATVQQQTQQQRPRTMRQAVAVAHRLMKQGKNSEALNTIGNNTSSSSPEQHILGGGGIGNRAAKEKLMSALHARR